jgi:hypothetical protein
MPFSWFWFTNAPLLGCHWHGFGLQVLGNSVDLQMEVDAVCWMLVFDIGACWRASVRTDIHAANFHKPMRFCMLVVIIHAPTVPNAHAQRSWELETNLFVYSFVFFLFFFLIDL